MLMEKLQGNVGSHLESTTEPMDRVLDIENLL